ncbi:MAG: SMP-30/gluconolactonase/LRE family protein [Bacteroidota bacterium]
MKYFLILLPVFLLFSCKTTVEETTTTQTPSIPAPGVERMAAGLDALIEPTAELETLADGLNWSEGPVWVPEGGYLLFSDVPENTIYKWKEGEGKSVYLQPSGFTADRERAGEGGSNGLALDQSGQLILCQHGDRRLARMTTSLDAPAPEFETIADKFEGKKFNSPNDVAMTREGDFYFTDPPYGLVKGMDDPGKEIDFQGVYKVAAGGEVSLISDQMTRPNGIALSPDERTLYVANSDPEKALWMAYSLDENGEKTGEKVFFDATDKATKENPGMPDGLKVDANGNLFATGPGGVWIFSPDGEALGLVRTGHKTANCALGADGYLYMTADDYLMRIKLKG